MTPAEFTKQAYEHAYLAYTGDCCNSFCCAQSSEIIIWVSSTSVMAIVLAIG